MINILIATHNAHKLKEFQLLLEPLGYRVIGADDVVLPDTEETGTTFQENSALKAMAAAEFTNMMAIADDSGLCVHALNNEPGIYSARYAAANGGYPAVFDVLLGRLTNDLSAHFHCCLCLAKPNEAPLFFEGDVYGQLTPHVETTCSSFGFDPIFRPAGYEHTFGGLPKEIKNTISHRAKALAKLVEYLKKQL
ncbi:MAG: RdgB/HAM1 family non-canonical purine NTP pyrophosphatase [Alphaproteobacteria bacterium]|nr:RdgB/HAM1 family non-canonical purine NTP pyrophosphatase [Alphaproteobacteria bacterium]